VSLVSSTTDTLKETDRASFSRLLRHPARKRSRSILSTPEPHVVPRPTTNWL